MQAKRLGLCVGLVWLLSTGVARADISYSYVFDQPAYTVNPGGTVAVGVSLGGGGHRGQYVPPGDRGADRAGVRVRFDIPPLPSALARVLSLADILPNTIAFDNPDLLDKALVPGSYAEFSEAVDIASPPVFGTAGGFGHVPGLPGLVPVHGGVGPRGTDLDPGHGHPVHERYRNRHGVRARPADPTGQRPHHRRGRPRAVQPGAGRRGAARPARLRLALPPGCRGLSEVQRRPGPEAPPIWVTPVPAGALAEGQENSDTVLC